MRHLLGERHSPDTGVWARNGKTRCQRPKGMVHEALGRGKVSSWWRKENEA